MESHSRKEMTSVLFLVLLMTGCANSQPNKCTRRGQIYTSLTWYGYLLQKTFQDNVSVIEYAISFPVSECCAKMLIYYDGQVRNLTHDMSCEQRHSVLNPVNQVCTRVVRKVLRQYDFLCSCL